MVSDIVTVNAQLVDMLALSVAVHVTVVVPSPNVYGASAVAAGEHNTLLIPLPAVAVTVGVYPVSETVAVSPLLGDPM